MRVPVFEPKSRNGNLKQKKKIRERERELKEDIKTVVGLMVTAQNLFIYQKREGEEKQERNQGGKMKRRKKTLLSFYSS